MPDQYTYEVWRGSELLLSCTSTDPSHCHTAASNYAALLAARNDEHHLHLRETTVYSKR